MIVPGVWAYSWTRLCNDHLFFVVRTIKIWSLSNCAVYNTVVLAVIPGLCVRPPTLMYPLIASLYSQTASPQFPHSLAFANHHSTVCFHRFNPDPTCHRATGTTRPNRAVFFKNSKVFYNIRNSFQNIFIIQIIEKKSCTIFLLLFSLLLPLPSPNQVKS